MDAAPSRSDSGDCWHAVGEAGGRRDWSDGIPAKRRRTERNRIVYRALRPHNSAFDQAMVRRLLTRGARQGGSVGTIVLADRVGRHLDARRAGNTVLRHAPSGNGVVFDHDADGRVGTLGAIGEIDTAAQQVRLFRPPVAYRRRVRAMRRIEVSERIARYAMT